MGRLGFVIVFVFRFFPLECERDTPQSLTADVGLYLLVEMHTEIVC